MCRCILERATRIELATSAWEADVLPLNYARITVARMIQKWSWKRDLNTRPAHYECAALPTELFQHRILLCGIRHSTYILYHKFLLCQEVSKKFSEKSKKRLKSKKRCVIMIGYCKNGALRARVPWGICTFSAKMSEKQLKLQKRCVIIGLNSSFWLHKKKSKWWV